MSYKYPNFAAEMARSGKDYGVLYDEIATALNKSSDTVSNWFTGRSGQLPTNAAMLVQDKFFPSFPINYLFSEEPIYPEFDQSIVES